MRYLPRLITFFPSSVASTAMILGGVSLHQVSPVEDGDCTTSIMVAKNFGDCTRSAVSPRLFRNAAKAACVFFFQAEDGIRDKLVTGVQTCALPISPIALLSLFGCRIHPINSLLHGVPPQDSRSS